MVVVVGIIVVVIEEEPFNNNTHVCVVLCCAQSQDRGRHELSDLETPSATNVISVVRGTSVSCVEGGIQRAACASVSNTWGSRGEREQEEQGGNRI